MKVGVELSCFLYYLTYDGCAVRVDRYGLYGGFGLGGSAELIANDIRSVRYVDSCGFPSREYLLVCEDRSLRYCLYGLIYCVSSA